MRYLAQSLSVLYGALITFLLLSLLGQTNLLSGIIEAAYLPYVINSLMLLLVVLFSLAVWRLFGLMQFKNWTLALLFLLWLLLAFVCFGHGTIA